MEIWLASGVFMTQLKIYGEGFFVKINNEWKPLIIFAKTPSYLFDRALNPLLCSKHSIPWISTFYPFLLNVLYVFRGIKREYSEEKG